ncbi:hypothetical protein UU9_14160 [Rhodanobacter fulvus Jip2]|uniref:ABC-2 type transport system permease protein n=1 Tax=Rhodanobacter fulvus Jip2 TaxID=1163408 RepID=I4VL66_9GAMM|nr:hypothetical protein [Rhodanobacter fulvus]EIL87957.1 hypothetical protein UU9_14160 [Rhodanobacter fulvus Jip2]
MNPLPWLRMPWYCAYPSTRWFTVVVYALCAAGAVASSLLVNPDRWKMCLLCLFIGQITLWTVFLPNTLRLAVDIHALRVPGVQQQIVGSLLLYGALTVVMPAAWLTTQGAPVWSVAAVLALSVCGGMAWVLVPRYLGFFFGFFPYLLTIASSRLNLSLGDPQTTRLAALLALVLLLIAIGRGRRLIHDGASMRGWSSPMLLQVRPAGRTSGAFEQWRLRQRPESLRILPDLAGAGPSRPGMAVRIALGGAYLPRTGLSYARYLARVFGAAAVVLCMFLVPDLIAGHGPVALFEAMREILHVALPSFAIALTVVAGTAISASSVALLKGRWQRVSGELPLLALLPGLGDGSRARRILLRAGLSVPLAMHTAVALLLGAAMLLWHGHAYELAFLLLAQLGSATVTTALLLDFFGGRPVGPWHSAMLHGACFTLTLLSLGLPWAWSHLHVGWAHELLSPLALGWLLLALAMSWLGRRGWQELQQIPHPFLAHQ